MGKRFLKILTCYMIFTSLLANMIVAYSISDFQIYYETFKKETISDGLTYELKSKMTSLGWVDIHVLKMDLLNKNIGLDIIRSREGFGKLQSLSEMVGMNEQIVGAMNASRFNTNLNGSDSQGLEIQEDYTVLSDAYNAETQGVATFVKKSNGELFMDFMDESVSISTASGQEIDIYGINTINDLTYPIVYNRQAYSDSSEIDLLARLYKVVVLNGVIDKIVSPTEVALIPENGYIISINETFMISLLQNFIVGQPINLKIQSSLNQEFIELAISGNGLILQEGLLVTPPLLATQLGIRQARSAIGITEDHRYLIAMVVEGNTQSIGATHEEMANYLQAYQVDTAMYFAESSFAELMVKPARSSNMEIANQTIDFEEEPTINGLAFVNLVPVAALSRIEIISNTNRTFKGTPISVEAIGFDLNNQLVAIDHERIIYSNSEVTGSWSGNLFTPTTGGKGVLSCKYGELSANYMVSVADDYLDLTIEPRMMQLNPLETGLFTVIGTDFEGYKLNVSPQNSNWKVIDSTLGSFVNGEFVSSGKIGTTRVILQMGTREVSAYVVIGETTTTSTIKNTFLKDSLMATTSKSGDFIVSVFGTTDNQNKLLDNIVLDKAYSSINHSDLAIFAGFTKINNSKIQTESILWNDTYTIKDYQELRVITLATSLGGLANSDGSQWQNISNLLAETAQNNILFIGNKSPVNPDGFQDEREGQLLHEVLRTYQQKTGKTIFFINGSGQDTNVNFYEGIRYIDLNGLNNIVQPGNKVDLYNNYYMLEFYIDQYSLKYQMKNIYPKVEIQDLQQIFLQQQNLQ